MYNYIHLFKLDLNNLNDKIKSYYPFISLRSIRVACFKIAAYVKKRLKDFS